MLDELKKFRRVVISIKAPLDGSLPLSVEPHMTSVVKDALTGYMVFLDQELQWKEERGPVFTRSTGTFAVPVHGGKITATVKITYDDWRDTWLFRIYQKAALFYYRVWKFRRSRV
jgi:hypothetical protein